MTDRTDGSPSLASVDPATIPGPQAANLGDGANGRLSEKRREDLLDRLNVWWSSDWPATADGVLDALADLIDDEVREHTERAWDEGAIATADRWDVAPAAPNPYRATRQETEQ